MARTGIRASAIIVKNNKILLIHRIKGDKEYWVLPGGGVEEGETYDEAVVREVKEETNLDCIEVKRVFEQESIELGIKHPFYICKVSNGEVKMIGEEKDIMTDTNWYNPEWVDIEQLQEIEFYPNITFSRVLEVVKKI